MFLIHLFLLFHRFHKSSVLFGTHTVLDKSCRVLQLPTEQVESYIFDYSTKFTFHD